MQSVLTRIPKLHKKDREKTGECDMLQYCTLRVWQTPTVTTVRARSCHVALKILDKNGD